MSVKEAYQNPIMTFDLSIKFIWNIDLRRFSFYGIYNIVLHKASINEYCLFFNFLHPKFVYYHEIELM
jgi:hypothetical protein